MKQPKKNTVKAVVGKVLVGDLYRPLYAQKVVESFFLRMYPNHLHHIAKLSRCALILFYWCADKAPSGKATVFNNSHVKAEFIDFCKKHCGLTYTDSAVKAAFQQLSRQHLLIPHGRGAFIINPLHYFRGTEAQRVQVIKDVLKEAFANKSHSAKVADALGSITTFYK